MKAGGRKTKGGEKMRAVRVVLFLATALLQLAGCDEHDHKYEEAEEVFFLFFSFSLLTFAIPRWFSG